jgi:hypothetical protein
MRERRHAALAHGLKLDRLEGARANVESDNSLVLSQTKHRCPSAVTRRIPIRVYWNLPVNRRIPAPDGENCDPGLFTADLLPTCQITFPSDDYNPVVPGVA